MHTKQVIQLSDFRPAEPLPAESGFDSSVWERRARARFRRSTICACIVTTAETLVTAAIGVCVVISMLAVLAMR